MVKMSTGILEAKDDFASLGREVAEIAKNKIEGDPDFAIVYTSCALEEEHANQLLSGIRDVIGDIPMIGCTTAGEFTEEKVAKGVAIALIKSEGDFKFFTSSATGLKEDPLQCIGKALATVPKGAEDLEYYSLLCLADGLAGRGEEAALSIPAILGPSVTIYGGTAGDNYRFQKTFVFENYNTLNNAFACTAVFSKKQVSIAIKHGHKPISEPMRVTKAKGNIIYEIDGKPAKEVLIEAAREEARKLGIDVDNMWDNPQDYIKFRCVFEPGLEVAKDEYRIRWILDISRDKDYLAFACTIPEGAMIRFMAATPESEIESTRMAAEEALRALNAEPACALVFDCAVRGALLGDRFPEVVEAIKEVVGDIPLIGFETYGEFGLLPGGTSGFHNTTTVVTLLPK